MEEEEEEPLLPYHKPRRQANPPPPPPITHCSSPEHSEITVEPSSVTPSTREPKDTFIYGSSSSSLPHPNHSSSSNLVEVLTRSPASPKPSISSSDHTRLSVDGEISNVDTNSPQCWLSDPDFPFCKTILHRSKTAPAILPNNEMDNSSGSEPPQFGKTSIVGWGFVLLSIYLCLGVITYSLSKDSFKGTETHPVVDALYFSIVTMCTIGYGDITPDSTATKLFSIIFVIVGFGVVDIMLTRMLNSILDLQENYLLETIKSRGAPDPGSYIIDVKKGRMRIRTKVAFALGVLVLCIGTGVAFMHFVEGLDWVDSFYMSVMSVTTVGYGDRAFNSLSGRVFACIWLLLSTVAVAKAFLYLAELKIDERNRSMAKWVLGQDMTVTQFLAADTNNLGSVTKSDFIVYKLKEMGKVLEQDIEQISKQFERLDSGNSGKITLSSLMEGHH